jgi:hypothetical protein
MLLHAVAFLLLMPLYADAVNMQMLLRALAARARLPGLPGEVGCTQ